MQIRQNILFAMLVVICTGLVQQQSFAQTLQITTVTFGAIALGDTSDTALLTIRNIGTDSVTLRRLTLSDTRQNFTILGINSDGSTSLALSPNQSVQLRCRFTPKDIGTQQSNLTISFTRGSAQQSQVVQNALVGRGTALKIVPPSLDTVLVGSQVFNSVLLINRWTQIIDVNLGLGAISSGATITLRDTFFTLAPGDSAFVPMRFQIQQTGNIDGLLRVISRVISGFDTLSAKIPIYGRLRGARDAMIQPGIRAVPDSAAPGDTIRLEVYISSESSSLDDIFRASLPNFSGTFSLNGNLAQLLSTNGVRPLALSQQYRSGPRYFRILSQFWDGREKVLFSTTMQVMASDTDQTEIQLNEFQWGIPRDPRGPWETVVFVLPPRNGFLKIKTCTAGGKRLFTPSKTTAFALQSPFPNPVNTDFAVTYTVNEKQHLSLALYNAQGNLVRTIKSAPHEAGEYSERLETGFLATGIYFLRLSSGTTMEQRVVNVIK
jgi:hypothetical protein